MYWDSPVVSKMLVRDLRKKATLLGINTLKMVTHRLVAGWEGKGKGKGLLQILWERGWVNESLIRQYKMRMEDDAGVLIPEFSLAHMMESCTDFQNKILQLEFVCHELGCKVLITTRKYHAEYAGEDIEYLWGLSKAMYRKKILCYKKGKQNFDALVSKCISRTVLTKDVVRKFSQRARSYMLTYKSLGLEDTNKNIVTKNETTNLITLVKIESMKKVLKSHRVALDFDKDFVMGSISMVGFKFEEEIESNEQKRRKGRKRKYT